MKEPKTALRKSAIKGRPDYYITPTRDFTQYTRDSEEKYWSQKTKFDWHQDIRGNLKAYLENLEPSGFSKILDMVLPMVEETLIRKITQIRQDKLPLDEDALKDIAECIPFDRTAVNQALLIQSPLKSLRSSLTKLKDQLAILTNEFLEIREQQRLGFYKQGSTVKRLETDAESKAQTHQLSVLTQQINQMQSQVAQLKAQFKIESEKLKAQIEGELRAIEPQVLMDLEETRDLIQRTLQVEQISPDSKDLSRLKDLILKRQLRGLKDIANHALVVEQSAIAPLTMGIIHYKRYREIQEAMTTFINDEAKHSATFRRYLVEKLEAREFISALILKGATRYMWIARFMPGAGMFLAVIVEVIGAATLEFFSKEEYMPDSLFRSICLTISMQDERRHMDLCIAMYNELFRKAHRRERLRNAIALKVILKSVYGDKSDDHQLIQAFRAFGVDSKKLYSHVVSRLSEELARIGMYVEPDKLLVMLGRK